MCCTEFKHCQKIKSYKKMSFLWIWFIFLQTEMVQRLSDRLFRWQAFQRFQFSLKLIKHCSFMRRNRKPKRIRIRSWYSLPGLRKSHFDELLLIASRSALGSEWVNSYCKYKWLSYCGEIRDWIAYCRSRNHCSFDWSVIYVCWMCVSIVFVSHQQLTASSVTNCH